jgi:RNA polymerase sigma factor (sigma-70 family)
LADIEIALPDSRTRRFERIVLPHFKAAFGLACRLMQTPEDGEDALQDALIKALRHFDNCREETAKAWFLRVVRNVCFDMLRARGMLRQEGFADLDPTDPDGAAFVTDIFGRKIDDPETLLATKTRMQGLENAIAGLPVIFRETIVLRDLEGMSYAEIAAITGVPIGTVMSRLSRGRDLLTKTLAPAHGEPHG